MNKIIIGPILCLISPAVFFSLVLYGMEEGKPKTPAFKAESIFKASEKKEILLDRP